MEFLTWSREIAKYYTRIRDYIATRSQIIVEKNVETISTDFIPVWLFNRGCRYNSSRLIADERREENQLFLRPCLLARGRGLLELDNKGASRFTMHCIAQSLELVIVGRNRLQWSRVRRLYRVNATFIALFMTVRLLSQGDSRCRCCCQRVLHSSLNERVRRQ